MKSFSPYISLSGVETPYDLNVPGAVLEIKKALVALAIWGSDPNLNPDDPIQEQVWQGIQLDDSWDASVADELVLAMGRYKNLFGDNHVQQGGSPPTNMVGGLQPTAAGLECLAGAVEEKLGGYPKMEKYLNWRGGAWDPPSWTSGPADNAQVIPSTNRGGMASTLDYVPLSPEVSGEQKNAVLVLDRQLSEAWKMLLNAENETQRAQIVNAIKGVRLIRNTAVLTINASVPPRQGTTIVESGGKYACEKSGGTYDTNTGNCSGVSLGPGGKQLVIGGLGTAFVIVGAAIAVAAIYLNEERKTASVR
jgi:hypothetical protein